MTTHTHTQLTFSETEILCCSCLIVKESHESQRSSCRCGAYTLHLGSIHKGVVGIALGDHSSLLVHVALSPSLHSHLARIMTGLNSAMLLLLL